MFGYVTINKAELKVKDYDKYHAFYCGLCHALKKRYGRLGQFTLTYDMTFVTLLLTSLYEEKSVRMKEHCLVHPAAKQDIIYNRFSDYGADMNMLLTYYKLLDDWEDDRDYKALIMAGLLKKRCRRAVMENPRQAKAIKTYIVENKACENANEKDFDKVAGCTGRMMAELLCFKQDEWSEYLRQLGFYLGKFIYLMDAYDDLDKDERDGSYNPLRQLIKAGRSKEQIEAKAYDMLMMMGAGAAAGFEKLPILENTDILRNILYSGIWGKYNEKTKPRNGEKNERSI